MRYFSKKDATEGIVEDPPHCWQELTHLAVLPNLLKCAFSVQGSFLIDAVFHAGLLASAHEKGSFRAVICLAICWSPWGTRQKKIPEGKRKKKKARAMNPHMA